MLAVFQTSVCAYWDIAGVRPNIVFVFVICYAVLEESFACCTAVPLICGVVMDALCGNTMFYNALSLSVSSLICYSFGEHFFKEKIIFAIPMVFVFTFISEFMYMIFAADINGALLSGIRHVILPLSIYNMIMTLVIYPLCKLTLFKKNSPDLSKKIRKRN